MDFPMMYSVWNYNQNFNWFLSEFPKSIPVFVSIYMDIPNRIFQTLRQVPNSVWIDIWTLQKRNLYMEFQTKLLLVSVWYFEIGSFSHRAIWICMDVTII